MTIFTKPLNDPGVVEALKKEGRTVLEVTTTSYYLLETQTPIEEIATDWFIRSRGRSHAYRDGSKVGGGADVVTKVKVLTEGGRVIELDKFEYKLDVLFDDSVTHQLPEMCKKYGVGGFYAPNSSHILHGFLFRFVGPKDSLYKLIDGEKLKATQFTMPVPIE